MGMHNPAPAIRIEWNHSTPVSETSAGEVWPILVPDHTLIRSIGRGSYGEVWLARNILGTYRAVKIVHRSSFADDRPFEREFAGMKRFEPVSRSHESQLNLLQVGRGQGCFYYVMELADDMDGAYASGGTSSASPNLGSEAESGNREDRTSESRRGSRISSNGTGVLDPDTSSSEAQSDTRGGHPSEVRRPLDSGGGSFNPDTYTPRNLRSEVLLRGRLPATECLRIGLALTTALEHLHKHGLVHRDIKPSNIVFVNGIPKLADIGLVAMAESTMSFVGTEGYLPPEGPGTVQADLFSLGKVLYEISTGHDRQRFPELPTGIAELSDRAALSELNEVLLKACHRDVKERYQTAAELHADLALLDSGKSVTNRNRLERRLKFMTRLAVTVVAVMVLGVLPYFWAIQSVYQAKRSAQKATTEAAKNREVADFLRQLFESVQQSATLGQDTAMVKGILDRAKTRVSQDLKDQPEVQADLLNTIGNILFDLGEGAEAVTVFREAVRLRRGLFGETNVFVAETLVGLGAALEMQGDGREAELAVGQALKIRRQVLGDEHPEVARTLSNYGTLIRRRPQEAEVAHREALRMLQRRFPEGNADVAEALDNLGLTLKVRGKLAEGEQIARQSLDLWRRLAGHDNADVGTAWVRLGVLVRLQQRNEEAEPLLREGYRQRRKFLGVDHPYSCSAMGCLATALGCQAKFAEEEQLLREHLSMCKKTEGNNVTRSLLQSLLLSLVGQGKLTEAQAVYRDGAELEREKAIKPTDRSDVNTLNQTAWFLATRGEPPRDGARALELAAQTVAASGRTNAYYLDTLAAACAETGQFERAIAAEQAAIRLLPEGTWHEDFISRLNLYVAGQPYHEPGFKEIAADSLAGIISGLLGQGKFTEAEAPARALVAFLQTEWPENWRTFSSQSQLGGSLLGQQKHAEAEPLLLSGYKGLKLRQVQIPTNRKSSLGQALQQLVRCFQETGQTDEAAKWQAQLDEYSRAGVESDHQSPDR